MSNTDEPGAFVLSTSASHLLHRAQQLAADWFSKRAGDKGVTLRQFAVLAAIAEKPGQSQTDLVRATGVDRSTLADMISRMEKRGWVGRKQAADDARAKAVSLTAAGRRILAAATPHAAAADEMLLEALPRTRRDAFVKTLELLAAEAEKPEAQAPAAPPAERKTARPAKTAKPVKPAKAPKAVKPVKPVKSAKPAVVSAAEKPKKAKKTAKTKSTKPRK